MDPGTQRLFERVAQKLGWDQPGALDHAAEKLRKSLKSRHDAVTGSDTESALEEKFLYLSCSDGSEKENLCKTNDQAVQDSSDEEFDLILAAKVSPKPASKPVVSTKSATRNPVPVLSSDSDDRFENFLSRVKTPKAEPRPHFLSSSDDGLKRFIVDDLSSDDDFIVEKRKPVFKAKPKPLKPISNLERRPVSRCDSPVFLSDDDDNGDIAIKSTWRSRHSRPSSQEKGVPAKEETPKNTPCFPSPLTSIHTSAPASAPPAHRWHKDSSSSDDEFQTLLERIRKNEKPASSSTFATPKHPEPKAATGCVTPSVRLPKESAKSAVKGSEVNKTPVQPPFNRAVSQTEPRAGSSSRVAGCKTPGCFLQSLSFPDSVYCRSFKQKKEELTGKLYQLYNTSVFENKLPADMTIKWNSKMRKTAGYCITGQERSTGTRYARIELSVKVCDSADRLRDTLVHEMCHAATWLINNVRDGHGRFWKTYARKATLAHPELPMVTRCHSYDINYKYQYQCNRCKNTIGRHSKSLDTQRFVCALCTGPLVLLTPAKPRGPTPFATFVKENYGNARQELAGQSHADVMRKLSADFASKARISQSS